MPLPEIIIDTIRQQGPLSFRDFMEMALYYPGEGYYTSPGERIGQSGDFYTSPYLTQLFGEMIAGQLEEMWGILDRQPFTIVEYGAGTGMLCQDILNRLKTNPALYSQLQYIIIEKSAPMREKEKQLLFPNHPNIHWESSLEAIPPVTGCILSNELVDNFAVHQVVMEEELMEVFVTYDKGFTEVLRPASRPLQIYLQQLNITLPKGSRMEINLEATDWIARVAAALQKGFVITIDYGNSSSSLYNNNTSTLACFHKHSVSTCPYDRVGQQDITSHVNFSALDHWGRQSGLEYCGFTTQGRFLQGLGLTRRLHQLETPGLAAAACQDTHRKLYNLLVDMGNKFKVLIQRKGLGRFFLSGLQFCERLA
jgi:SAM-dependent MidA family methyltransferase